MVEVVYSYAPRLMFSERVALYKGDRNEVHALKVEKTN